MAQQKTNSLKVGDLVTHTGKRGFWDIEKGYKGIGFVLSPLYKMYDRKYVHDVWFTTIGQVQQIGAGALEKVNTENDYERLEHGSRANIRKTAQ